VDKLAFEIGVADGIEKTAISNDVAMRALARRIDQARLAGGNADFMTKGRKAVRMINRTRSWKEGKNQRVYLHKRTGAGMEQLMRRAQEVKKSPVADKVVGSSKKKNIAMGLGAAAGVGAMGAGAYGLNRALKDD
jgi:hypothetical protein